MKYAFWGLLIAAATPVSTTAQDHVQIPWGNKFFIAKDPPPVIVHDFGTIPWGATLSHRFIITNIYAVPMNIVKDPTPTCNCVKVVRYTQVLEPRQQGYIDIEMDGRRFQGAKAVTLQVPFGPKYQSTAILQVRAFTRTDVTIYPGQVNFGTVALGQKTSQNIDITYTGQQQNWQIDTEIDAANAPAVTAMVQRAQAVPNKVYRLTVSLKPDAQPGVFRDQILLRTNDAQSPILAIPVTGTIQSPLEVVQGNNVKLDPTSVGQETKRNIMVRGNKPFKIVKVDGDGAGLSTKFNNFQSPIQMVTISFTPSQPGVLQRKLTFTTDQKEAASVIVEAMAEEVKK